MCPDVESGVPELDSRILRWKIDDITTSDHFAKKVGVIPMEFSSTEEFLGVFRVPLLEEVRAQLHQGLGKSMTSSHDSITTAVITKVVLKPKKALDKEKRILEFSLRTELEVTTSDLILLCSDKPRWDATRECVVKSDSMIVLACVVYVDESSPLVSAAVYLRDESQILRKLVSKPRSVWHAVLPGVSLTPARRIWNAICAPFPSKAASQKSVTHSTLRIDRQVIPIRANHSLSLLSKKCKGAKTLRRVEDYCNSRALNKSQRDVVKSALAALLAADAKPHVRMVQGPPGTGKTAMLVTLISVLGGLQCRTLISAPTNAAVVEISKRVMRFFDGAKNEETFSGFCSRTEATPKQCLPIALSAVVLVGSKKRLEGVVDGTMLEEIFLPYRIDRLNDALNPKSGWKGSVESVVEFLKKAPELFNAKASESDKDHSQSKASKLKKKRKSKKAKMMERNASFWRFARNSMVELRAQMQKAALVLMSELPRCHMDMATSDAMTSAANLMTNLVDLMPSEAPVEAETWFSIYSATVEACIEKLAALFLSTSSSTAAPAAPAAPAPSAPPPAGKMEFLVAQGALMEALKAGPGCALFATEAYPKGFVPSCEWLEGECLRNATLVFSTVSGAGSPQMMGATFECAIIDEASQLVEAESTIVTRRKGLNQLILVGDHKQLPATVISKVAEKCGYGRSLFDRLQTLQHGCRHMLNIQYRMAPTISRFPNCQFYEGKVEDGPNVRSAKYGNSLHNAAAFGAYAFLDCRHGAEVAEQKSWKNPKEVEVVIMLVTALGKVCAARNIGELSVGVISPYGMQVQALKQSLDCQALHRALQVEVKTVDGFQGNERDVIIFSAVRSNHAKNIGFVDDCRRLNVAITRGRHCVWIVGNASTLSGGGKIWKKLVADAKARNCYHTLQGLDRNCLQPRR